MFNQTGAQSPVAAKKRSKGKHKDFQGMDDTRATQKYNSKGQVPFDLATEDTLVRLSSLLGKERFERLKNVQDTVKDIKPPVPFYNRRKNPKQGSGVPGETSAPSEPSGSKDIQE
ncbi:serine threonine kinase ripk4, putative [Babesia ovis]|uniref:Serine threonine kinase ripk4, putative n=1 Tax=Babesia ovis TaxID=5869 RepID=A0A9W5TEA3_BABOV|nr:serine threonine kinase ripk4, putative [Babesia ovis]